jgi:hypothetical protein
MGIVKVKVVVYENDEEMRTLTVGYFPGQPYVVKIDTPDGVDRQYEGTAKVSASRTMSTPSGRDSK